MCIASVAGRELLGWESAGFFIRNPDLTVVTPKMRCVAIANGAQWGPRRAKMSTDRLFIFTVHTCAFHRHNRRPRQPFACSISMYEMASDSDAASGPYFPGGTLIILSTHYAFLGVCISVILWQAWIHFLYGALQLVCHIGQILANAGSNGSWRPESARKPS